MKMIQTRILGNVGIIESGGGGKWRVPDETERRAQRNLH